MSHADAPSQVATGRFYTEVPVIRAGVVVCAGLFRVRATSDLCFSHLCAPIADWKACQGLVRKVGESPYPYDLELRLL